MPRTYVPSANMLATGLHKYLTRYQATLIDGASEEKIAALADLINCLVAFLVKWPKPPINP